MYCLSKSGRTLIYSKGFYIEETDSCFKYYENNEDKYNVPGNKRYNLKTKDGYIMDTFNTEEDAKHKLIDVMRAAASGAESYEF